MPLRRRSLVLTAAIILSVFASTNPAAALSQIDPGEGGSDSKQGIIAVPLPPLPPPPGAGPAVAPSQEPSPPSSPVQEGTDAGETPLSPEEEAAEDSRPSPVDDEHPVRQPGPDEQPAPAAAPAAGASHAEPLSSEIAYGEESLPRPVRDLRARLMEIARSGEIERLRPYIESGEDGTMLSFGPVVEDPIEFLRSSSGDGDGIETLAIMLEILEAGHARTEPDSPNEIYVWPYFTRVDLKKLTPPQKVELFELVTAGDFEAMKDFGAYNFYRLGITPEGRLAFFVAGD